MQLKVKVEKVFFPRENQEGDFYVIGTDQGNIVGKMSWRPAEKEMLALEGDYGLREGRRQFKFTSARADIPVSPKAQLTYVIEITSGFGYAIECQIWDEWGETWMDDLEPDVVKTLNGDKYDRLVRSVAEFKLKREMSETVAWMVDNCATINMAQAAWNKWEKETVGVVKADCYRLAELPNFGFSHVDKAIRLNFGITDTDPRRLKAAVIYSIKDLTNRGSTIVTWYALRDRVIEVLGGMLIGLVASATRELFSDQVLVGFGATQDIALQRDFENAEIIMNYITGDEL